jgi:hypothetical protein
MTNEELHALFVYEPDKGMLRRLNGRVPYPWRFAGAGYLVTTHAGVTYYHHRLVWQYHHGTSPPMIDHRDGVKSNDRIENLRECTPAQNQYNSRRKATNRSGYKGVVLHPNLQARPWQAKMTVDGRRISFGYYATKEEAAQAYAEGALRLAAEFARSNA